MLGWSIRLFRVRGIQVCVHWSLVIMLAWIGHDGWTEAGAMGLFWSVATGIAFFACILLHEFGHSFAAMRFGVGVRRILLMPIGGMAEFDRIPRSPGQEFWVTAAGPAVNFVLAGVLAVVLPFPDG